MHYCSLQYTTWFKLMLLVFSCPINWEQAPKGKTEMMEKAGTFWNMDHEPTGCI